MSEPPIERRERAEHYLPLTRESAARFLDDWEGFVRRQLRRLRAEEEDVLYRVFDRALGALPRFREESRLSTWLYRISTREALRHLEKQGRLRERELPLEEAAIQAQDEALDPEAFLQRREDAERVRRSLSRLDPRDREILALRYLDDLKLQEIAARFEIPLGTVKTRVHRALNRLRQELEDE